MLNTLSNELLLLKNKQFVLDLIRKAFSLLSPAKLLPIIQADFFLLYRDYSFEIYTSIHLGLNYELAKVSLSQ